MWTRIGFGKHRTRSVAHVILTDPEWFYWAYHEDVFQGQVLAEARLLYQYARSIKTGRGKGQCFEYRIAVGGKPTVLVVAKKDKPDEAYREVTRSDLLDIEFPRQQKGYKPEHYEPFMESVQLILFGTITKPYVKKDVCEKFFATPKNFSYQAKTGRQRKRRQEP